MGDGIVGGSYRGRRIMGRGPYRVGRMVSWEDGIVGGCYRGVVSWGGWYREMVVS